MKPYIARKLVEFAASLLILIPCVLLLAWESQLPHVIFFWFVLMICSGTFLFAMICGERRRGNITLKRLIGRCGGFFMMFLFVFYQTAILL